MILKKEASVSVGNSFLDELYESAPVELKTSLVSKTTKELHEQAIVVLTEIFLRCRTEANCVMAIGGDTYNYISQLQMLMLEGLEEMALTGNPSYTRFFLENTESSVCRLNYCAKHFSEIFSSLAADHCKWPVFYSPHNAFRTDVEVLQQELCIGSNCGFNIGSRKRKGKRWHADTPVNRLALELICELQSRKNERLMRRTSRPETFAEWDQVFKDMCYFCSDALEEWCEDCWDFLLEKYNGHPEDDPHLAAIGRHCKAASIPAHTRSRLREKLSAAMELLAAPSPEVREFMIHRKTLKDTLLLNMCAFREAVEKGFVNLDKAQIHAVGARSLPDEVNCFKAMIWFCEIKGFGF